LVRVLIEDIPLARAPQQQQKEKRNNLFVFSVCPSTAAPLPPSLPLSIDLDKSFCFSIEATKAANGRSVGRCKWTRVTAIRIIELSNEEERNLA
jgi:hypothetical protein